MAADFGLVRTSRDVNDPFFVYGLIRLNEVVSLHLLIFLGLLLGLICLNFMSQSRCHILRVDCSYSVCTRHRLCTPLDDSPSWLSFFCKLDYCATIYYIVIIDVFFNSLYPVIDWTDAYLVAVHIRVSNHCFIYLILQDLGPHTCPFRLTLNFTTSLTSIIHYKVKVMACFLDLFLVYFLLLLCVDRSPTRHVSRVHPSLILIISFTCMLCYAFKLKAWNLFHPVNHLLYSNVSSPMQCLVGLCVTLRALTGLCPSNAGLVSRYHYVDTRSPLSYFIITIFYFYFFFKFTILLPNVPMLWLCVPLRIHMSTLSTIFSTTYCKVLLHYQWMLLAI